MSQRGQDQPESVKKCKWYMNSSVFFEVEFLMLIVFSLIFPVSIYYYLMKKRVISRKTVLFFGILLVTIAGVNVYLLRRLAELAKISLLPIDDLFFRSELSLALYLLPVLFAGIGVNMISHVLISHLSNAEKEFDRRINLIKLTR
ncbi:MAG: hypothetical protein WDM70_01805 [Nitrosomonadales bacterium]